MKKQMAALLVVLFVSMTAAHSGSHGSLPEPGNTPGTLSFGLQTAMEKIDLALTFNKEAKAEKRLHIARKRLSTAKKLILENNSEKAAESLRMFEEQLNQTREQARNLPEEQRQHYQAEINDTLKQNSDAIRAVMEKAPEEAMKGLRIARMRSGNQRTDLGRLPVKNGSDDTAPKSYVATGRVVFQ